MKKSKIILIIVAVCLVCVGAAVFIFSLKSAKGSLMKLGTLRYEEKAFVLDAAFENIDVSSTSENINILPSEDGKCTVKCFDKENLYHTAQVTDKTLEVKYVDERKWYDFIEIAFGNRGITIYLPENEYKQIKAEVSSGNIEVSGLLTFSDASLISTSGKIKCAANVTGTLNAQASSGDIEIGSKEAGNITAVTTSGNINLDNINCADISMSGISGSIKLNNVNCKDLQGTCTSGSIKMNGVIASNMICKCTSGSIKLEDCDAESLEFNSTSGSVEGNLLSDKVYITSSSSGSIKVPESVSGGKCKVTTTSGSIKFR